MKENAKLYEITDAMNKVESVIEDEKELSKYLDSLNIQLVEKAKGVFMVMKNLEAPVVAIDNEINRLQTLKKSYQNKADSLKQYVSYSMQKNNIDKIEADIVTFSFRKSDAVIIDNENVIPEKYVVVKTSKSIDKIGIKKALKDGKKIDGAGLEIRRNLQIR